MRPALLPAHRQLWRDPATLQLGRSGGRAAVVHGLDPALRPVLDLLDGIVRPGDGPGRRAPSRAATRRAPRRSSTC